MTIRIAFDRPLSEEEQENFKQKFETILRMMGNRGELKIGSRKIYFKVISRSYPTLYWIQKPASQKDLLIFDGGYEGGDIHIYEHKESLPAANLIGIKNTYSNYLAYVLDPPI